ncbi:23S rRNA (uracil(1939)-C(5))-methyltransferase RlmD [Chlamydiifrater phoenicopteri]|uniref:23S rRNA (uracil(1939)-C(5))-methyltransferase RlmD n=1 Tax=Chlamydiifrater phoenicopteri TaxID=2681469 RepID=UPI001BD10D5E|nr:23S rRNA (uracil(1939)-C(5))-methyltransferase RlmD [Chlamydiifrater phoenicopteri]
MIIASDTPPACPHFGSCGGCSYPRDAYELSLKEKQDALLSLFSPLISSSSFQGIVRSQPLQAFRNKMEFSFFQTVDGNKSLGLMSNKKPRYAVPINSCFIAGKTFIDCLELVRSWWHKHPNISAYFAPKNKGSLISLTIRKSNVSEDILIMLTSSGRPEYKVAPNQQDSFVEHLLESSLPITSIVWEEKLVQKGFPTSFSQKILYGEGFLWQKLPAANKTRDLLFKVYAKSFFQPNPKQAAHISQIIYDFLQPSGQELVLDLFCGAGTLGICLADSVCAVQGIEIVPDAVTSAKENILINQLEKKVSVAQGDAKTFCRSLASSQEVSLFSTVQKPDVVIVDPPRCGMQTKTLKYLLRISPPCIIYVSCNPKTQYEECETLSKEGYELVAMKAVDQFPFTTHVENIVLMRKK